MKVRKEGSIKVVSVTSFLPFTLFILLTRFQEINFNGFFEFITNIEKKVSLLRLVRAATFHHIPSDFNFLLVSIVTRLNCLQFPMCFAG